MKTSHITPDEILDWLAALEPELYKLPYWHFPKGHYHFGITYDGTITDLRRSFVPIEDSTHSDYYPDELLSIDPVSYDAIEGEALEFSLEDAFEHFELNQAARTHLQKAWGNLDPSALAPEILRDNVSEIGRQVFGFWQESWEDTTQVLLTQALFRIAQKNGESENYELISGASNLELAAMVAEKLNCSPRSPAVLND
jgi:hypothetical protein